MGHCLREENLNASILALVDDFGLYLNNRFEDFLDSLLGFHLINCLDVASFKRLGACCMNLLDRICAESFSYLCRHVLVIDQLLIV